MVPAEAGKGHRASCDGAERQHHDAYEVPTKGDHFQEPAMGQQPGPGFVWICNRSDIVMPVARTPSSVSLRRSTKVTSVSEPS